MYVQCSDTCHGARLTGIDPLAYLMAKTHGLTEEAESILESVGLTEDQIKLPSVNKPLRTPQPIVPTYKANWPVKSAGHSMFEKALLGEVGMEDQAEFENEVDGEGAGAAAQEDLAEEEEEATGWDMDEDIPVEEDADFVNVESADAGPVSSEADLWSRNSPLAADHVAAGSFDTAMQLLNRQVGAVNFAPLKERFLEIYNASRTYLPATGGLPPLVNYVRRTRQTPARCFPSFRETWSGSRRSISKKGTLPCGRTVSRMACGSSGGSSTLCWSTWCRRRARWSRQRRSLRRLGNTSWPCRSSWSDARCPPTRPRTSSAASSCRPTLQSRSSRWPIDNWR